MMGPHTAMMGPENALSWALTQPWARGRLPPVIPSPGWGGSCSVSFVSLTFSWDDLFYSIRAKNANLVKSCQFRSASRFEMSSDCTPGIACDKFSPAPLWPKKIVAPLNKISLICKNS